MKYTMTLLENWQDLRDGGQSKKKVTKKSKESGRYDVQLQTFLLNEESNKGEYTFLIHIPSSP